MDNNKFISKLGYDWVYWIHTDQIRYQITTLNNKDKMIIKHLKEYCFKTEDGKRFIVKTDNRNRVLNEFRKINNMHDLQKIVHSSLEHQIYYFSCMKNNIHPFYLNFEWSCNI